MFCHGNHSVHSQVSKETGCTERFHQVIMPAGYVLHLERQNPAFSFFCSGCWLCSLRAGGWQGASHDPALADGQAQFTQQKCIYQETPTPRHLLCTKYRAGQTTAELPLSSGLVFGTVLGILPLLPMKPTWHPRARGGAWVSAEQMPVSLQLRIVSGSLCGPCVTQRKPPSWNWAWGLSTKAHYSTI